MHEQDFEKQVQQKMEELSLTPSAPVWQKVEGQIRKKKDRRRIFFWLLPLLVAGGGAYWWLSGSDNHSARTATNSTAGQTVTTNNQITQPTQSLSNPANTQTPATVPSNLGGQELQTASSATPTVEAAVIPHKSRGPLHKASPQPVLMAPEREVFPKEVPAGNETVMAPLKKATQKEEVVDPAINNEQSLQTDTAVTSDAAAPAPKTATPEAPPQPVVKAPTTPTKDSNALAETPVVKKTKVSKWQWAANIEGGIASAQPDLLQLPSARALDVYMAPATGSTTGNYVFYTPSPLKDGAAFSAGATLKRMVTKRFKVTAGVQYNYYSTHMTVGEKVDTAATFSYSSGTLKVSNYYRPNSASNRDAQTDYRNQYHFVQVPVGLEYQLFRQLPLQLQTGVSFVQMIRTNALLYDYGAHIYYQNSGAFNKTQLHLFTNITYTLWKGKDQKLNAGPYAQYSLSQLQKDDPDKNRLFSAGLRTQLSF